MSSPHGPLLTRFEARWLIGVSAIVAITRWPALAQSLLDWDEAQFVSGVREYDVALHHPHPPGYPVFIAVAKLFYWSGMDEFRALQAVVLIGAVLLVPAACLLARAMRFDFTTSLLGAVTLAYLPNVWIYGGTGFSDIPALTCALAAAALLLHGRDHRSAFVWGGLLLGLAIGLRPLSVVLALVPVCLGAWGRIAARDVRAVAAAGALVALAGGGGMPAPRSLRGRPTPIWSPPDSRASGCAPSTPTRTLNACRCSRPRTCSSCAPSISGIR
jgi:4-amino-4-deoxy-L-arabinose transferase-like glycosyltransferase